MNVIMYVVMFMIYIRFVVRMCLVIVIVPCLSLMVVNFMLGRMI